LPKWRPENRKFPGVSNFNACFTSDSH